MIYAVIAFGYQLTFATSDTLNFGQGEALMLGALVGLTLVGHGRQLLADDPASCACSARCRARSSSASACGRRIKIK